MSAEQSSPSIWKGSLPKIGIRPTIDGRLGGVRESFGRPNDEASSASCRTHLGQHPLSRWRGCCVRDFGELYRWRCRSHCVRKSLSARERRPLSDSDAVLVLRQRNDGHGPDPSQSRVWLQRYRTPRCCLSCSGSCRSHAEGHSSIWNLRTRCSRRWRRDNARRMSSRRSSPSLVADLPRP